MAGSIKGIIVEIGGDTSGLQKALAKVNSATSSLTKELKGINSLLKLDPSNTELLAQKQEVLAEQIQETSNKLELLKQAQEEADEVIANGGEISQENYRNLQREIILTQNKLKSLQNEASKWTQAGKKIEEFGTKVEKVGEKISKLGSKLSVVSTAVGALGTYAANSSIEFESAFTGVVKTVDATDAQLAELEQGIKDLAEEVPATTTEIAAVAEAAGQLGIATDDVLDFTKVMIDLGESTNLSAEEAASSLAKFANITGTASEDYDRLGSVIVDLGNNFATTEADIVDMATNLAASGELAGLTEPQIFALATAMSSVGIEAEAGGTSMSKLLRQMQTAVETGSTDLESFASVADMTASEFKKAFEEDAVGALSAFIDGLNDTERNGKTATVILQDMGITETRLTNTILSLANSSDVMTDAIDTANSAWGENTALTEEAEKRYDTTESQIQIVKNKFSNLAISIGDELLPIISELLDKVSDMIDNFSDLSDEEKDNIVKTGLVVVAIGPLVKILGTVTNKLGTAAKGVGTLVQAIGVLKTGTTSANSTVNTLAKVISNLTSPVALITAGFTAASAAVVYFATKQTEAEEAAEALAEEAQQLKESYDEFNNSIDETMKSEVAQIDTVSRLKDELITLVDENGKVKEGYESRADFILNELNDALGTEYSLNDNLIDSYQELQGEIDTLIEKKRAEIILSSEEEKYTEAINQEREAVEKLNSYIDEMGMSYEEAKKIVEDYYDAQSQLIEYGWLSSEEQENLIKQYSSNEIEALSDLVNAYGDTESVLQESVENQEQYMTDYALFTEGKYDEIGQSITTTMQDCTNSTLTELTNNINTQKEALDNYSLMYQQYGSDVALELANQAQTNLESLAAELAARTQTITTLGEEEKTAWKTLAQSSFDTYSYYVSQMSPEMQEEIQEATGVVIASTPEFAKQAGIMGDEVVDAFDQNEEAKESALSNLQGFYEGLSDEEKQEFLKATVGDLADEVADEFEDGDYETSGKNVLQGLYDGLSNGTLGENLINKAANIAKNIANQFNIEWDEHSPSKLMKQKSEYLLEPIGEVFSKHEGKLVNTAKRLAQEITNGFSSSFFLDDNFQFPSSSDLGNLTNRVIDGTRAVSNNYQIEFNVQELDEQRLQQCFNYVNKKFSTKY